jgi:CubicO group peptidase (beta-lactamase class C family)
MSTRDLARFGQLYLQEGRWGDAQVVPAEWVRRSTLPSTGFGQGFGYGAMWWTFDEGAFAERFPGRFPHLEPYGLYYGDGTGGQTVAIVPEAELVFVHRGDTDNGEGVDDTGFIFTLLDGILSARLGEPVEDPDLGPLAPVPFASQQPAPVRPSAVPLDPSRHADYVGTYEIAPGMNLRVFPFAGRLFGFMPGQGEAELIPIGEDTFTVRVMPGVRVVFERAEAGRVEVAQVTIGPEQFRAVKR